MAYNYADRVWFLTPTTGTGTINVGAALPGYQLPVTAGLVTGNDVGYTIVDGANWEVGTGTLTSGGTWTMTRDIVEQSSSGTAKLTLSGSANCFLTASAGVINAVSGLVSVAALRASRSAMANVLQVMGYATPGDGGEGQFILMESDTTSADNGGTIIVDASARRWYRMGIFGNQYSVKWFGAKGDGATDDIAAINATIAAAAVKGGVVYFPPGVYAVRNTISIKVPDVTLQGSGAGNWMFGFQPNKGTTLLYTGTSSADAIIDIAPVIPSGQFIWCVNVRDMTLDCNGVMGNGIIAESLCNGEFANLNIFQPSNGWAIYLAAAPTTNVGFTMRCNFRNINISTGATAGGIILDGQPGGTTNIGGVSLCYFENIQVTHSNGNAYQLVNCDSNFFLNCGASRSDGGGGWGLVFGSSSDGSGRLAENNRFYGFICAATPTGTASPVWAQGGLSPSINNYVEISQMDGDPYIRIDYAATLYYQTIGSYVSGTLPKMFLPGIYTEDAGSGAIPSPTRLRVRGNQNNNNVLIDVLGGIAVGGGANATLPMWYTPMALQDVAFASLPIMGAGNSGCMVFCYDGRRPSEGAGAGTGVPVFWNSTVSAWISVCSGLPVTH